METIVFSGGLGNQLFQYAFYLAKKKTSSNVHINIYSIQRERLHNGFELEKLFGIQADDASLLVRIIRKLLIFKKKKYFRAIASVLLEFVVKLIGINVIREKGYSTYNPEYLRAQKGLVFYFGFWQSPWYFDSFREEIRKTFSFDKSLLSDKSKILSEEIGSKNSVSVHIRRGDFLSKSIDNAVCDEKYYSQAMERMKSDIENPYFVFFSDDPEWVKANLALPNAVYVDWNQGADAWQDMYLMSQCRHNIIANSTFSWWGAWLNENVGKTVIAPVKFMKQAETPDIYPLNWIRL
ncbi:MAG: alpha-1,2-fucosyltransferase [Candidatus Symbiothrix sp.]|jgi:hypothetical protein|nr:alpha-1,2-fucosyltransferase [Candidatus Symbiothrix sp.]